MTVPLGFWSIASGEPHRPALVDPAGRRTTFGELAALTNRYTRGLQSLGLGVGDGVLTILPNGLEQVALRLAAFQGGMIVTTVNRHLTVPEVAYMVRDSDADVLVTHERFATVAAGLGDCTAVAHRFSVGDLQGYRPLPELIAGRSAERPERLATGTTMIYTSGTTGRPKGVRRPPDCTSPDESAAKAGGLLTIFGVRPHEGNVHLCVMPMYHAAGGLWVTMSLHLGHTVVLMDRWDAVEFLELIERHRVTHTHMVPTMFHRLLQLPAEVRRQYDLSSLRHAVHAAAPCPVGTKSQMLDWWGDRIWEYYGATEGGGTIVGPAEWRKFPGTVGRPWPGGEVIVVGPDGTELPPGRSGTVYMRMPDRYRFEYHKDRPKTDEAHRGEFFTVGDVGRLNAEGYLFLEDRAHDVIITGGVNVYPAEVEGVMHQCPLVGDVAVFGVPDEDLGESIKAVVEPAPGVEAGEAARQGILDYLSGRLARPRHPHSIDFCGSLPRDPSGKLYKRKLRDRYWEGHRRRI